MHKYIKSNINGRIIGAGHGMLVCQFCVSTKNSGCAPYYSNSAMNTCGNYNRPTAGPIDFDVYATAKMWQMVAPL